MCPSQSAVRSGPGGRSPPPGHRAVSPVLAQPPARCPAGQPRRRAPGGSRPARSAGLQLFTVPATATKCCGGPARALGHRCTGRGADRGGSFSATRTRLHLRLRVQARPDRPAARRLPPADPRHCNPLLETALWLSSSTPRAVRSSGTAARPGSAWPNASSTPTRRGARHRGPLTGDRRRRSCVAVALRASTCCFRLHRLYTGSETGHRRLALRRYWSEFGAVRRLLPRVKSPVPSPEGGLPI